MTPPGWGFFPRLSSSEMNVGGMARELAAQDSDNSNDMNG
jgi:hypothetical protein